LLGRRAFARFLGRRIAEIPEESGAYSIHIYGPWGAGKSTLLNFLRKELEGQTVDGTKWLVVEFNA
jgi:predicted KAP-like P-loop ATPase